jgi:UDP:flavonoid glycosyltransferase YjiC (YdhE family)
VRLTLIAVGSRGDVQYMLALGRELDDGGHDVRIVTHPPHEQLCVQAGVPFFPLANGRLGVTKEVRLAQGWGRWRGHAVVFAGLMAFDARAVARERLAQVVHAGAGSDAIIASAGATLLGWQLADYLDVPLVRVSPDPSRLLTLHGPLTRAARNAIWLWCRTWLNSARIDLGMPKLGTREPIGQLAQRRALWLRPYSPELWQVPSASQDWVHATGFWFIDGWLDPPPTPELVSFIDAGPPPLCIGFGSLEVDDPRPMIRLACSALDGRRGVLVHHAFGERAYELPANVFGVGSVPYDWLFARCAAVVHHCGSGTAGAALRAGAPTVPVPHAAFQMRWARRLHELGVATAPIPERRLTVDNLRAALTEVADPEMRRRVAALQRHVAAERGTATARRLIEEYLDRELAGTRPLLSSAA